MLIQVIAFQIHNVKEGIHEEFVVENTEENYEKIAAHRYTREIEFKKVFDFEFGRVIRVPAEFIDPRILAGVILAA